MLEDLKKNLKQVKFMCQNIVSDLRNLRITR